MRPFIRLIIYVSLLALLYQFIGGKTIELKQVPEEKDMKTFVNLKFSLEDWINKVNIPRVSGSKGNAKVRSILVDQLKKSGFEVEIDNFEEMTPIGKIAFANVIGKKFIDNRKYKNRKSIILAAHYDSKYFKDLEFFGTTDSATSVGLLLNLSSYLADMNDCMAKYELTIVFFDGEEAFEKWSLTDSVYGARHLSEKWKNTLHNYEYMILFDLLGGKDAKEGHIRRTQYSDKYIFDKLLDIDNNDDSYSIFGGSTYKSFDDDHRPFMEKGLKIVHIIPETFPSVWHTVQDTIEHVDMTLMMNYDKLLKTFIVNELELQTCIK